MKKLNILIFVFVIISCSNLRKFPSERYYSFTYYFSEEYKNDTLFFHLSNPLMCPLSVKLRNDSVQSPMLNQFGSVLLKEKQDTTIKIYAPNFNQITPIIYSTNYGDVNRKINLEPIAFPFPVGREYEIIQGYRGKFSHNDVYSRYSIDFGLKIGDTITCVDDGYVVGVIEDYKGYGTGRKWLLNDRSNYITLYHPQSGLFSQYVHLDYKGALVELGAFVRKRQAIGICGMTGYTNIEHLHFTVKYASPKEGLIAIPIAFENRIQGGDLKRNNVVK